MINVIPVLVIFVAVIIVFMTGEKCGERIIKQQAIEAGVAKYILVTNTQDKVEFMWIK